MKYILNILLLLTTATSFSQSPVIDILTHDSANVPDGGYYKDGGNHLNKFDGTWLYTNGNTSLKIVLQKKVLYHVGNRYYEDIIIGEYQYIKNGIEIINTLSRLNDYCPNPIAYGIQGNSLIENYGRPNCTDCAANEKRVRLMFGEIKGYGTIVTKKLIVGGQDAIRVNISKTSSSISFGSPPTSTLVKIPIGEFILIKQP